MCADESGYAELPNDESPFVDDSSHADDTASAPQTPDPDRGQEQWHPVEEDDPSLLDQSSRALESAAVDSGPGTQAGTPPQEEPSGAADDGGSDMALGTTDAAVTTTGHPEQTGDWEHELSAHRVAVELRRVESDLRAILEERDPKRKRKLSGTARWHELEDDILSWRFSGRFEETSLQRLQELIRRRHYLFNRLRFLASTRPTWNT